MKAPEDLEAVDCPTCEECLVELGSGTAVTCVCMCGVVLLVCRDKDGKLTRREVIEGD